MRSPTSLLSLSLGCVLALGLAPANASPAYAPYVDFTAWPVPQIDKIGVVNGIQQFTLAFVVADRTDKCTPSWGTYFAIPAKGQPAGSDQLAKMEKYQNAYLKKGGAYAISFGGADNVPLAMACKDDTRLEAAYQTVIDRYAPAYIDFDIEGGAQTDIASLDRRFRVVAKMQGQAKAQGKELKVILTLPTLESGMTGGVEVVRRALANHVDIAHVNVMAMDYGHPVADMGQAAMDAAQGLHDQLQALYAEVGQAPSDEELWAKVGITPMIGENDSQGEIFGLQDAKNFVAYAEQKRIGVTGIWSVLRDREGNPSDGLPSSSHVKQDDYEFSRIFNTDVHWGEGVTIDPGYQGDGGGDEGACGAETGPSGYVKWCAQAVYDTPGSQVDYEGQGYQNAWWAGATNIPGLDPVWVKIPGKEPLKPSPVVDPIKPSPIEPVKPLPIEPAQPVDQCDSSPGESGAPKWCSNQEYCGGTEVDFNGGRYKANWCSTNKAPNISPDWLKIGGADRPEDHVWSAQKTYATAGEVVTKNGVSYRNKWWTLGDDPENGGVWEKI